MFSSLRPPLVLRRGWKGNVRTGGICPRGGTKSPVFGLGDKIERFVRVIGNQPSMDWKCLTRLCSDYETVFKGLGALERSGRPDSVFYRCLITMWKQLGQGKPTWEGAIKNALPQSVFGTRITCDWIRCPLHDDAVIVPSREMMRCARCEKVRGSSRRVRSMLTGDSL